MTSTDATFIAEENNTSSSSESDVESGGDEDESVGNLAHFISPNVNDSVTLKTASCPNASCTREKTSVQSQ